MKSWSIEYSIAKSELYLVEFKGTLVVKQYIQSLYNKSIWMPFEEYPMDIIHRFHENTSVTWAHKNSDLKWHRQMNSDENVWLIIILETLRSFNRHLQAINGINDIYEICFVEILLQNGGNWYSLKSTFFDWSYWYSYYNYN